MLLTWSNSESFNDINVEEKRSDNFMNFNNLIGQEPLKKILSESINKNKVAHAYLFEGPWGIGKKSFAKAFAKLLMCTDIKYYDNSYYPISCGVCNNCVMFDEETHPDYHYLYTDKESIKIDEIRSFFADINLTPHYSKRKIYVIDGAEKMTIQSQNCILKTLEEPPVDTIIILLTTNKELLLSTIISRVLIYTFKRYTKEEVAKALAGLNDISYDFLYSFSDGIIGQALHISNDDEFNTLRDLSFDIIKKIETTKFKNIIEAVDEVLETNKVKEVMQFISSYYRDILVLKFTEDNSALINSDKKDIILDSKDKLDINGIVNIFQYIKETQLALNTNANESLVLERFILRVREEYKRWVI